MPRRSVSLPLFALAILAILALSTAACTPTDARARATPTSLASASVRPAAERLRAALLTPGDVPGDLVQLAKLKLPDWRACGTDPFEAAAPLARAAVAYGNAREQVVVESLQHFDDATAAAAFVDTFAKAATACSKYESNGSEASLDATPFRRLGDGSHAYATKGQDSGGLEFRGTLVIARQGSDVMALSTVTLGKGRAMPREATEKLAATAIARL